MARPEKNGLDYFPLDVDIDQDDKVQLIEAKYGIIGFGIIIKLLMKIYKEGYYYSWTEKEQLLFAKRVNVDINQVNDVINECLKWGLFDKTLFDKYGILTSHGIQKRYLAAVSRRSNVQIIKEYFIIDYSSLDHIEAVSINPVNDDINPVNDDKNDDLGAVNDDNNTQSKVKKSKVNKSKVNKITYAEFVTMTEEEYNKLVGKYGEENTKRMIEKLDNYKGANGKNYKSDYRAILNWVADEVMKGDKNNGANKQAFNSDNGRRQQYGYKADKLYSRGLD